MGALPPPPPLLQAAVTGGAAEAVISPRKGLLDFIHSLPISYSTGQYEELEPEKIMEFEKIMHVYSEQFSIDAFLNKPDLPEELHLRGLNLFQFLLLKKLNQLSLLILDKYSDHIDFKVKDENHLNILIYAVKSRNLEVFRQCFEKCLIEKSRFDWYSCQSYRLNIFARIIMDDDENIRGDLFDFFTRQDIYFRIDVLKYLIDFARSVSIEKKKIGKTVFGSFNPTKVLTTAYDQCFMNGEPFNYPILERILSWMKTLEFVLERENEEKLRKFNNRRSSNLRRRFRNMFHNQRFAGGGRGALLQLLMFLDEDDDSDSFSEADSAEGEDLNSLKRDLESNFALPTSKNKVITKDDSIDSHFELDLYDEDDLFETEQEKDAKKFIVDLAEKCIQKTRLFSSEDADKSFVIACCTTLQLDLLKWYIEDINTLKRFDNDQNASYIALLMNHVDDSERLASTALIEAFSSIINSSTEHHVKIKAAIRAIEMLEYMIKQGADVSKSQDLSDGNTFMTPLTELCRTGRSFEAEGYVLPIAAILLENGADPEIEIIKKNERFTHEKISSPLFDVLSTKQARLLQLFLVKGKIDVHRPVHCSAINGEKQLPLEILCKTVRDLSYPVRRMIDMLRRYDAQCGSYIYSYCAFVNKAELPKIKYLCDSGIDVDMISRPRMTPLVYCAAKENLAFARYLLSFKANPHISFTLSTCTANSQEGVHRLVCFANPKEKYISLHGRSTALLAVCDVCGASILDQDSNSCFHCASPKCDFDICQTCGYFFSNVNALDVARRRGNLSMINLFSFVQKCDLRRDNNFDVVDILQNANISKTMLYSKLSSRDKLLMGI